MPNFLYHIQIHLIEMFNIIKAGNKSIFTKIDAIINKLHEHPTTGTANTKPLKSNHKGQWSRRIT